MYVAIVVLLMFVLPLGSVAFQCFGLHSPAGLAQLFAASFAFWAVGIRLFLAGLRQSIQPSFTAREIFGHTGDESLVIIRELGFANLAIGALGIASALTEGWVVPASLVGGLFYTMAGIRHLFGKQRNALENLATFSDLFVGGVLLVCFICQLGHLR